MRMKKIPETSLSEEDGLWNLKFMLKIRNKSL
jgi:hypothetical protein